MRISTAVNVLTVEKEWQNNSGGLSVKVLK